MYDSRNEFRNDYHLGGQPASLINEVSETEVSEFNTNINIGTPNSEFRNNHQHDVLGSITELLDTDFNEMNNLELSIGLTFANWQEFKVWIDDFAKKKGFNYKIRTSQMDGEVIRCITYECSRP